VKWVRMVVEAVRMSCAAGEGRACGGEVKRTHAEVVALAEAPGLEGLGGF
jgi:hypothetical protein